MNPSTVERRYRRQAVAACTGLVLTAGVPLAACGEAAGEYEQSHSASHYEPAKLEPIKGTEVQRVRLTAEGARRTGIRTAEVRRDGRQKVIPYAAVIYDSKGKTYTYTNPEPLVYVREKVEVDRVDGDRVVLSGGPPVGTRVVTVGAAEVYGTEFEVAH